MTSPKGQHRTSASRARLAAAVLLAGLTSACGGSTGFFAVRNTAEPPQELVFTVVDTFTTAADPVVLPACRR